ncbi:MAG: hypothetical protein WBC92_08855 [Terracidiphilus sp.]
MHRPRFYQTLHLLCALSLLLVCVIAAAQQAPAGRTVIKDPAEYKAYMTASSTQDATARAEGFAAFVQDYPHSVVLTEALDQEMAAWQQAGDSGEVKKVAKRLLEIDSGNIRVLGILVALDRVSVAQGDKSALNEMCTDASGGMLAVPMWHKPADMTEANYVALSKLMNEVFFGAEGFCEVQEKDYSQGKEWLTRAYKIDPTNVQDSYQLAIADLEMTPLDAEGFWYCARAVHLAQSAAIPQDASEMVKYCKAKYASYHGADDGWDALVETAATQDEPPTNFAKHIKAGPAASPQK